MVLRSYSLVLLLFTSVHTRSMIPEIHDWIQQNIYICDLDPSFGRTRFLSREEATIFRCQCGRTGLACAQHLEQPPFCSKLPSTCLDEWRIQFGGKHATFPTLAPSISHPFVTPRPSPQNVRIPEFAVSPPPRDPRPRRPIGNTRFNTTKRLPTIRTTPFASTTITAKTTKIATKTAKAPSTPTKAVLFAGDPLPNSPKTIIFETFPSLVDLRRTVAERETLRRKAEEKLLTQFKDERTNKGFNKLLSSSFAVKKNPSLPLPDFASELSPKQIVEALNHSDTKDRIDIMVEDRLRKVFEEEKLLNSARTAEKLVQTLDRSEDTIVNGAPVGVVEPTPLTEEDLRTLKSLQAKSIEINSVEDIMQSKDATELDKELEREPVKSEPIEMKSLLNDFATINNDSRLSIDLPIDNTIQAGASIPSIDDSRTTIEESQGTARNVAHVMARLLREIIGDANGRKEIQTAPPGVPPENVSSVLTGEELQEILITNVNGEKVLTASPNRKEDPSAENLSVKSNHITVTVTSGPLSIATTPPTELVGTITHPVPSSTVITKPSTASVEHPTTTPVTTRSTTTAAPDTTLLTTPEAPKNTAQTTTIIISSGTEAPSASTTTKAAATAETKTSRAPSTTVPTTSEALVTMTTGAPITTVSRTTRAPTTSVATTSGATTTSVSTTTRAPTTSVTSTTRAPTTSIATTTGAPTTSVATTTRAPTTSVPRTTRAPTTFVTTTTRAPTTTLLTTSEAPATTTTTAPSTTVTTVRALATNVPMTAAALSTAARVALSLDDTVTPKTTHTTKNAAIHKILYTTKAFNPKVCEDNHSLCNVWSKYGECEKNPGYMFKYCRLSCGICAMRRQ